MSQRFANTQHPLQPQAVEPTTPTKVKGEPVNESESEEIRAARIMEQHQKLYAEKRDR